MLPAALDLATLRDAYAGGRLTPSGLVRDLYPLLEAQLGAAFLFLPPLADLLAQCEELEAQPERSRGELWGVPFAVKDNVDVAGMPTTAACPAFSYTPEKSAPAVDALIQAGAMAMGKTNMDQFAAGLVGTRTPHKPPSSPFDSRFISGGSSSGSAAAVGAGLVSFAVGTDTAGSGRVPAGLCGCVGFKGTVGSVATVGVVPACASLDCLTIFSASVDDGAKIMRVFRSGDAGAADVWRRRPAGELPELPAAGFRFAVPSRAQLDWSGPGGEAVSSACQQQFDAAVARLVEAGGVQVDIDFQPLLDVAAMLYGSSFVAERYSGIRAFLESSPAIKGLMAEKAPMAAVQATVVDDERLLPVTRHIIVGTAKFNAADVFDNIAQLAALRARAQHELARVDALLVPTALTHWTQAEVLEEEDTDKPTWPKNAKLGRFTNFVNLLDMCGIAVPSGVITYDAAQLTEGASEAERKRSAHLAATGPTRVALPFGVTLLAPAWRDEWLWGVAGRMEKMCGLRCGPAGHGVTPFKQP